MNTCKSRSCHDVLDKNIDSPLKSYIAKNIDSVPYPQTRQFTDREVIEKQLHQSENRNCSLDGCPATRHAQGHASYTQ